MKSKEGIDSSRADPDWSEVAQLRGAHQISQERRISDNYADPYNTAIKSYSDFEKLSPDKQIEYVSDIIEAGKADTMYGFFEALPILRNITSDKKLPPLIRIIAKSGEEIDPNSAWSLEYENKRNKVIRETFGYSSIVAPEQLSGIRLSEEDMALSEDQIKDKLARIKDTWSKVGQISSNGSLWDDDNDDWQELHNRELELEFALGRLYFTENQKKLHEEFPSLPHEKQLVKIASDAAATVAFHEKYGEDAWFSLGHSLGLVSDINGNVVPLSELKSLLGTENNIHLYVEMLHNNSQIESVVGINPVDLPLNSQAQFLKYLAEAGDERFDKLCETLNAVRPELRLKIAKNLLAADFGDDFGDALLDIASSEDINDEQLGEILDKMDSCRESIHNITELYHDFDGGRFSHEYARAANERLTDALTVFREIAKHGTTGADLGWPGKIRFNYEETMEALEYETKSLKIISSVVGDIQKKKKGAFAEVVLPSEPENQRLNRTLYNLYSPDYGYVLLYTRPEGSHSFDETIEYGKKRSRYNENSINAGVEASISFITNPVDTFSLPNPYRPDYRAIRNPNFYDAKTMDKVSALRIDREGRAPGWKADDPRRDPINPEGMISVDLAAIGDRDDTPSGKIARLFSVGNSLRAVTASKETSLNHNTKWFDQEEYGTAVGFAEIVEHLDSVASSWCESLPPKKDEGFTGLMRKVNRGRGRKATGWVA